MSKIILDTPKITLFKSFINYIFKLYSRYLRILINAQYPCYFRIEGMRNLKITSILPLCQAPFSRFVT